MSKHAPAMDKYAPLPGWAKAPAYCMACSTLSIEAAGLDAEGDLVCPRCESVDVYLAEPAEGVRVVEDDEPERDGEEWWPACLIGEDTPNMPDADAAGHMVRSLVGSLERETGEPVTRMPEGRKLRGIRVAAMSGGRYEGSVGVGVARELEPPFVCVHVEALVQAVQALAREHRTWSVISPGNARVRIGLHPEKPYPLVLHGTGGVEGLAASVAPYYERASDRWNLEDEEHG